MTSRDATKNYPTVGTLVRERAHPDDAPWTVTGYYCPQPARFANITLTSTLTGATMTLPHVSRKDFWRTWQEA